MLTSLLVGAGSLLFLQRYRKQIFCDTFGKHQKSRLVESRLATRGEVPNSETARDGMKTRSPLFMIDIWSCNRCEQCWSCHRLENATEYLERVEAAT